MNQIETAAKWWGDVLAKGAKFDNMGDTGTPEERRMQEMTSMMASMNVSPVTDEQLDKFEKELINLLESSLELQRQGLHCDYGPCQTLANAAKKAGISESNFPWKTNMNLRDEKVMVSYGYGAAWEEVPPTDKGE